MDVNQEKSVYRWSTIFKILKVFLGGLLFYFLNINYLGITDHLFGHDDKGIYYITLLAYYVLFGLTIIQLTLFSLEIFIGDSISFLNNFICRLIGKDSPLVELSIILIYIIIVLFSIYWILVKFLF